MNYLALRIMLLALLLPVLLPALAAPGPMGECPLGCSGHGVCVPPSAPLRGARAPESLTGRVLAPSAFEDVLSEIPVAGGCECYAGWTGADCSTRQCPGGGTCSGHGTCSALNGTCLCDAHWSGQGCENFHRPIALHDDGLGGRSSGPSERIIWVDSIRTAGRSSPPCAGRGNCSGHGMCLRGVCKCDEGWSGVGCHERACSAVHCAGGRGRCVRGACRCRSPWLPPLCELGRCPSDCSNNGYR